MAGEKECDCDKECRCVFDKENAEMVGKMKTFFEKINSAREKQISKIFRGEN